MTVQIRSLAEILSSNRPAPTYLIPELGLSCERINVVCGDSGAGKTQTTIGLGVAASTGTDWLGLKTTAVDTLLVNYELPSERVAQEAARLMRGLFLDPEKHSTLHILGNDDCPPHCAQPDWSQQFEKLCEKYGLIIIDSLTGMMPGVDQSPAHLMAPVLLELGRLGRKHDCVIVLLHHNGKAHRRGASSGRGSTAIYAAADNWYSLSSQGKDENKVFTLAIEKSYLPKVLGRRIHYAMVDAGPVDPRTLKSKILRLCPREKKPATPLHDLVVEKLKQKPMKRTELYEAIQRRRADVQAEVERMLEGGHIVVKGRLLALAAADAA